MEGTKSNAAGIRLAIMMFLQFFVWGSWYVTAPKYLGTIGFTGSDFGWTYSVSPIAAIIAPFFVGMIADRFFATERVLGLLHLLGAAAMYWAMQLMQSEDPKPSAINFALLAHMLCYMPTLALTNTLALSNLTKSEQLPWVRVFGTLGWIIAGWVLGGLFLGMWSWSEKITQFQLAMWAGVGLGLYSFTLPHTPPPLKGKKATAGEILGLDALVLLKNRSYLIFLISSFLICIPLAFYYQLAERAVTAAGVGNPVIAMTFGQVSEVLFMLLLPLFFVRYGVKWTLLVGMGAWVARYALFAAGTPSDVAWMMILGILLHGICYDFFFVTGQIYTDKVAPPTIRGQAQGLLVLCTLGLGMLIGAQIAGVVEAEFTPEAVSVKLAEAGPIDEQIAALEKSRLPEAPNQSLDDEIAKLQAEKQEILVDAYSLMDWKPIWAIPAGAALVVLLIFCIFFREPRGVDTKVDEADVARAANQQELV